MIEFNTPWSEYLVAAGDRPLWRWKVNPHARNQINRSRTGCERVSRYLHYRLSAVGSVVIVEKEQPRGIVTDRDITIEVVAHDQDPTSMTAADVMNENLVTVDVENGIFDVIRTTKEASVRRIPAVDPNGNLAGIVAFDDFVILLGREFNLLGDVIEAETPPYENT